MRPDSLTRRAGGLGQGRAIVVRSKKYNIVNDF
jgi:hypothetical protein